MPVLADDVPPALNWHQFGAFQIDFASVLVLGAAVLYGIGVWRVAHRDPGRRWSVKRTVAFAAGLVVTFAAVEGFVGVYDDVLFYDHMIQHLMLIMVAAPLFAMGAPMELLERATTGRAHRVVEKAMGSRLAELVAHPVVDFLLYAILIPVCHLTSFYNFTLTHEPAHDGEHLLFLVIGYLFWRHVVAIEPTRHPLHPAVRMLYLALAVPVDTFTGLALASASHELFPAYDTVGRTWGPSLVQDLHIGGVIMWVCGDSLMLLAMVPVAVGWLRADEREAAEMDRRADAAGPGHRPLGGAYDD
ncbi:MAG TPA: cytochrome c oxidase assembly protein [Acidimicrobiales bacterium]|nr:cytochrome c oxidase assembly protein [Acidimicrobiales bacterium]